MEDAYKKWQKKEISENSWIVKAEDIIKHEYDLSAKNPNKAKDIVDKDPKELIKNVTEKEKRIKEILEKINNDLGEI